MNRPNPSSNEVLESPEGAPVASTPWVAARERTRKSLPEKEARTRQGRAGMWILGTVAVVALLLALLSLGANGLLIRKLLETRAEGQQLLDASIAALDEARLGDVAFSYVYSDTIVYAGVVPISQTVAFPFQGDVPFQGVVPVSFNLPVLGRQTVRVPIDTSVYVSNTITVPVAFEFPFEVAMPVEIPIDVAFPLDEQPELTRTLSLIRELLVEFRSRIFE